MRTITHSFKLVLSGPRWSCVVLDFGIFLMCALWLGGCAKRVEQSERLFKLTPETAQHRALQTRIFETDNENELLAASAAVLQDLGFQVQESHKDLGLLRATKERSAHEYGQEIKHYIFYVLTATHVILPRDLDQKIGASLALRRANRQGDKYSVRITFYRTVWNSGGIIFFNPIPPGSQRMEVITDGWVYQQFFAKLAKSVFLEAHKI